MLVSIRHRLVILATPKCASTALQKALGDEIDMIVRDPPGAKHTPFRKYDRQLRPFLESNAGGPLEVICLVREPVSWLGSWWRYRARAGIPDRARSTAGMSFAGFVESYLGGSRGGPADLGRQSKFVAARDGTVGVDRVFPYEDIGLALDWIGARMERRIALERVNVSPPAHAPEDLPDPLLARLREELAADFALHAAACSGAPVSGRRLP